MFRLPLRYTQGALNMTSVLHGLGLRLQFECVQQEVEQGEPASRRREKAKACYTGFALSDLDVSGGLPLRIKAIQPGTDFPQAPTA
jgi:hypothetical protein